MTDKLIVFVVADECNTDEVKRLIKLAKKDFNYITEIIVTDKTSKKKKVKNARKDT